MTELKVNLDFACLVCHQNVGVTVQCAGAAFSADAKGLAGVAVPCPCCGQISKLLFGPDGTVHSVTPHLPARIPEPSRN
jgi:hypothetical protein